MHSLSHGLIKLPKTTQLSESLDARTKLWISHQPWKDEVSWNTDLFLSGPSFTNTLIHKQLHFALLSNQESHTPHFEINLFWRN